MIYFVFETIFKMHHSFNSLYIKTVMSLDCSIICFIFVSQFTLQVRHMGEMLIILVIGSLSQKLIFARHVHDQMDLEKYAFFSSTG